MTKMFEWGAFIWKVIEALLAAIGCILVYSCKSLVGRVDTVEKDMKDFRELCISRHERERDKATEYATKGDIQTVHNKIDVLTENVQDLNNNVLLLATKR